MDNARFKENGWLIGPGAIEGTCKHLMKQRFAIPGARWERDENDDLLALRVAHENHEWNQYWGSKAA